MDVVKVKQSCFWCEAPATRYLNGSPFCDVHATCFTCGLLLVDAQAPVGCVCQDYGAYGHEDALFCGLSCMEAAHPECDLPEDFDEC